LHLSLAREDRRERFAGRWRDHADRIEREWRAVVRPDDLVLVAGDISMARNHREVQPDLAWLDRLPGTKILAPGNHDGWWNGAAKVRPLLRRSLRAIDGDALATHGLIVCGTKGAPVPADDPDPSAIEAMNRALASLDRALADAARLRPANEPLVVLWHYPPFDRYRRPGPCVDRFEAAGVSACVYGHLHTEGQWAVAFQGTRNGINYFCVPADAIGFRPLRIRIDTKARST
jgi:predicted phosphohydrolase